MIDGMRENMEQVRAAMTPDQWQMFCRTQALQMIQRGPQGEAVARTLFGEYIDVDALKVTGINPPEPVEVPPDPPRPTPTQAVRDSALDKALVEAVRHSMPGMKSQAQFDAFVAVFDSLRSLCAAIFVGDADAEKTADSNLAKALGVIRSVTDITRKLEEVPEAATSVAAEEFKRPPRQFSEVEVQARLLKELATIADLPALDAWYTATKADRDGVVTSRLRNELYDSIRAQKGALREAAS
jgi:hypothetical protein